MHQLNLAVILNPEHTLRKLSCLNALFRLFRGPLGPNLLDVSSDIYPEPSGNGLRSSEGREEAVAERVRSTNSCLGAAPPEAIRLSKPYFHGHINELAPRGPDAGL